MKHLAKKYFGSENPVGKTLLRNNGAVFNVTGVLDEIPENSHLKFDFLVSFQTYEKIIGKSLISNNWLDNGYDTYFVLKENTNLEQLNKKLEKYDKAHEGHNWSFHLQPMADIHFNRQIEGTGNQGTLFIFITIGIFILIIAGFNYMNLFIAHYRAHTKDIGIRRVLGVTRTQLAIQFLGESFLLVLLSFLFSFVIIWMVLPWFSNFIGEKLDIKAVFAYKVLIVSVCTMCLMTLIAGIYLALYLSGLKIID